MSPLARFTAWAGLAILVAVAVLAPILLDGPAGRIDPANALLPPGGGHPLGTDELGRDVLARVLVATRLSLGISVTATALGVALGVLVGALPAVVGRRAARLIGAGVNLAVAFPALLLALFVAAITGGGVYGSTLVIALALAPVFARLTQTLAASVQGAEYVAAARLLGVGRARLLLRHVVPNVAGPILVTAMIGISGALIVLSGLSFLGLGVQSPDVDWGVLLNQALNRMYTNPAYALAPAAAVVVGGLVFSLVGDALAVTLGLQPPPPRRGGRTPRRAAAVGDPGGALVHAERLAVTVPLPNGADVRAVRDVTFTVAPGERVGVVGESGCGKTMTALAVAGLTGPEARIGADRLEVLGEPLPPGGRGAGRRLRRTLGTSLAFVFQDPLGSFNPVSRIGGQLAEVAVVHAGLTRRDALRRAVTRLADVRIADPERVARRYPHELSGGMLQRGMIAMGLMNRPRLIVADEPTTALDVTVQREVLALLDRVCGETGAGLLLISHDLAVVAQTCERVLVMYAGRIVEDLPVAALTTGPAHPYTRVLLASVVDMATDRSRPLAAIPGRPPDATADPPGCAFAPRCPRAAGRCATELPELIPVGDGHRAACWHPIGDTA
ncbi:dipeptide/oligopeptide/nickel ABC transporter permease/ATP-binding protein [Rhizohabitans arisaemae]|uniref:dipeptide/oligopeptide/nickel ABC transporter permease/ATP-binding protein n=1 Tax=Rhizohabitans arisaemae TaxID=2720610 RepID=UPI0024B0E6E4|nr:dipeptide/oligopeptide/nickel ABC transporter permease/ATP-binding protein [Rhizohabitans arisaemae]